MELKTDPKHQHIKAVRAALNQIGPREVLKLLGEEIEDRLGTCLNKPSADRYRRVKKHLTAAWDVINER